jgi:hypothetical protein
MKTVPDGVGGRLTRRASSARIQDDLRSAGQWVVLYGSCSAARGVRRGAVRDAAAQRGSLGGVGTLSKQQWPDVLALSLFHWRKEKRCLAGPGRRGK